MESFVPLVARNGIIKILYIIPKNLKRIPMDRIGENDV